MSKYRKEANIERKRAFTPAVKNRLSEQELEVMNKELQTFYNGKYTDTQAWLISKGALSKCYAVVVTSFVPAKYDTRGQCTSPIDCDPILYEQLSADLEQWVDSLARKRVAML